MIHVFVTIYYCSYARDFYMLQRTGSPGLGFSGNRRGQFRMNDVFALSIMQICSISVRTYVLDWIESNLLV